MKKIYINCLKKLRNFRKSLNLQTDLRKGKLYFSWLTNKTEKIKNEQNDLYVYDQLIKNTLTNYNINQYVYNKCSNQLKNIISKNYKFDGKKYNFDNTNISKEDAMLIARNIILKRGNVVWIDFGFNIGYEFGGMHPAIILKNFDNELFVLPISSKKPIEYKKIDEKLDKNEITIEESQTQKNEITEIVQLDKIFGFKHIVRWSNITRMRKVSILRVNFSGSIGSISGEDLNRISEKIKQEF